MDEKTTKTSAAEDQTLTSRMSIGCANTGKKEDVVVFIEDYRAAVAFFVSYLWNNSIRYKLKDGTYETFDIKKQKYKVPKFFSTVNIPFETDLTARALKSAATQACGLVKAKLKKLSKIQYVYKRRCSTYAWVYADMQQTR